MTMLGHAPLTIKEIESYATKRIKRLEERYNEGKKDLILRNGVRMSSLELQRLVSWIKDRQIEDERKKLLANAAAQIKKKAGVTT